MRESLLRPEKAAGLDLSKVEGPYLRDILDQPRALEDTFAALAAPPKLKALAKGLGAGASNGSS